MTWASILQRVALCLATVQPMAEIPPQRADVERTITNPSGVSGAELPDIRQGVALAKERILVTLYDDAAQRINEAAATAITQLGERRSAEFRLSRAATLQSQIQRIVQGLASRTANEAPGMAADSYRLGLRQAVTQMRDIGIADPRAVVGSGVASFALIDQQAVDVIARDTTTDLVNAAAQHGESAARLFRAVSSELASAEPAINQAIARGVITGDTRAADRALRELFRNPNAPVRESVRRVGAKQITVGGWTGPVRAYTDTVVRTRTREATVTARHERLQSNGLDLVQITGRVSTNFCTRFIGLVVTLGPARDGYPSINELPGGAPPFHPNCSKGTALFHPELSSSGRASAHARALPAFRRAQASNQLTTNLA
tara:strand:+ start:5665 stop:6786 length:1122 start_codon:yes stop_codon:yes gene_type:complete